MLETPDQLVRAQIDAILAHLSTEGLTDIEELRTKTSEGFHTIRGTFDKQARLLRLSYQWLSDNTPEEALAWLHAENFVQSLKRYDYELTIHNKGMISGISTERLWFEFCRHGIQYYAAGRWSQLTGLLPIYGNQHHHAVEMFLKGALTRHRVSREELKKIGHNLIRLWAEFKRFAGDASLVVYDGLIRELDKFENIRYPDAILRTGMTGGTSIVPGDRAEMWSDGPPEPHYEVNLGEIDGLVAKIVEVIGVNRRILVNKLPMKEAKDTLLERNPHAAFWQIADD